VVLETRSSGRGLTGRSGERERLDGLLKVVREGRSQVVVLRGEPGVGKTALLDYIVGQASGFQVARAGGVQSEMELAFSGLHQLLMPLTDYLDKLPGPQRGAVRTAFGFDAGSTPDRFFLALAVLSLFSAAAEERPLLCVVDDEQWHDRASAQVLAFVARRLDVESVGIVFAARATSEELAGIPELVVEGLDDVDARALLDSALTAPLDARVRDQLVRETRGNPLALLEFVRGLTPAELAGGFALPGGASLSTSIEERFRRRLVGLPPDTRRLLLVAAADPTGEPLLVWRAVNELGVPVDAATAAAEAELLEIGAVVRFRHPLVRSAVYQSATLGEKQAVHGALADATDPAVDPDRRAWHRAQAAPGPDEEVAEELERSAGRAQARGGLAAAAAFLERAAALTPNAARRAQRLLAAARTKRDAGELDAALELLIAAERGPIDEALTAEVDHLRGQIALEQRRGSEAAQLLVSAARRLEPLDVYVARETHLEALGAAMWAGALSTPHILRQAGEAARAAPAGPKPPRAADVLLDALAIRLTDGYAAAAPTLARALELVLTLDVSDDAAARWLWLAGGRASALVALELWDAESWHLLAARRTDVARETGALVHLQFALNFLAEPHILAGELSKAALLLEEDRAIAEATGNPPISYAAMAFAAWRGTEHEAVELIESTLRQASARGLGRLVDLASYASSVLYNGLGRYDAARDAARQAFDHDLVGYGPLVVPELAEAAAKMGDVESLTHTVEWLSERTHATGSAWALGIEARVRALMSDGEAAERSHRESIEHLSHTRVRVELARAHLLFGEWLRRERRRVDAREHLRTAHEMLTAMGVGAFAERARRELLATGETVRKRTAQERDELTPQETQIARLARDGLSNPEIGARLFISPQTVKYHLRKVFMKLEIKSRSELGLVLPADEDSAGTG
jgi:DNA-binding CsgD family transcriptional regulator